MRYMAEFAQEHRRSGQDAAVRAVQPIYTEAELRELESRPEPGAGKPCPLSDADCEFTDTLEWLVANRGEAPYETYLRSITRGMVSLKKAARLLNVSMVRIRLRCQRGVAKLYTIEGRRFLSIADLKRLRSALKPKGKKAQTRKRTMAETRAHLEAETGLISVQAAARMAGVSTKAIHMRIARGHLVATRRKVGGWTFMLIDPRDVAVA